MHNSRKRCISFIKAFGNYVIKYIRLNYREKTDGLYSLSFNYPKFYVIYCILIISQTQLITQCHCEWSESGMKQSQGVGLQLLETLRSQ